MSNATYIGQFDGFHVSARIVKFENGITTVKLYATADGFVRVRTVTLAPELFSPADTTRDVLTRLLASIK